MISVIIGVYNEEERVARAIESVLFGTYTDIEIVVVDDGSTDKTPQVLDRIAAMDTRVKVITLEKNGGLAHALNVALEAASGEYIARMDADDYSYPTRLDEQLKYLLANPELDFCGTAARLVDGAVAWGIRQYPAEITAHTLYSYNPFIHPSMFFKRSVLNAVGGYRDEDDTWRCEDYDLYFRLYGAGFFGGNMQEILLDYFEPKDSAARHTAKSRKNEYLVRKRGAKLLHAGIRGRLLAYKPLIYRFIPKRLYNSLHNSKFHDGE